MSGERPASGDGGEAHPEGALPADRPSARFESSEGLEVVHADDVGAAVREPSIAGVVLAAGTSTRFEGRNKLLVDVDGEPLVRHAARTLLEADVDLDPVVAVVGHEPASVREALAGLDLDVIENPDYRDGQATSVRSGLHAVADAAVDAAVFALGDMPFVLPRSVAGLVGAYRAGAGEALAAAYRGERGNPVLFGSKHFDALADVEGDTGGRDILLDSDDSALVETADPGVLVDVDSPEDLEAYR